MNPKEALAVLTRCAVSTTALAEGPALQMRAIIQTALSTPAVDSSQVETLKAEKLDLTIRVAELEEELAEAKKPKRRTTRKKNVASNDDGNN